MTLMQRRRALMGRAKKFRLIIHESSIDRNTSTMGITPYQSSSSNRMSYVGFDIFLDGGKTYKITTDSTYQTAQVGLQFYTELTLQRVQSSSNIGGTYYDPGWQPLEVIVTVPKIYNNSPIVGLRLTFRQDTANSRISDDFHIRQVIIEEAST